MKISIILPSVRANRLQRFIDSIDYSDYEVVLVSPNDLPDEIKDNRRIVYVRDFGSPVRCSQIALVLSSGDLVISGADDCCFYRNSLKELAQELITNNLDILLMKYTEGGKVTPPNTIEMEARRKGTGVESFTECGAFIQPDYYFTYGASYPHRLVNSHNPIFNACLAKRSVMEELGGWDCNFQACPLAHADFGVRAMNAGKYKIQWSNKLLCHCDAAEEPDNGDHSPIERAQSGPDTKLYRSKYDNGIHNNIDINNWKNASRIWKERFYVI